MVETFGKNLKGRMTKFRISELSGVDRPAQAGATVAILKRARDPEPIDWVARKAACREAVDALAKARASTAGVSFEKAFSQLLAAEPELAAAVI